MVGIGGGDTWSLLPGDPAACASTVIDTYLCSDVGRSMNMFATSRLTRNCPKQDRPDEDRVTMSSVHHVLMSFSSISAKPFQTGVSTSTYLEPPMRGFEEDKNEFRRSSEKVDRKMDICRVAMSRSEHEPILHLVNWHLKQCPNTKRLIPWQTGP